MNLCQYGNRHLCKKRQYTSANYYLHTNLQILVAKKFNKFKTQFQNGNNQLSSKEYQPVLISGDTDNKHLLRVRKCICSNLYTLMEHQKTLTNATVLKDTDWRFIMGIYEKTFFTFSNVQRKQQCLTEK